MTLISCRLLPNLTPFSLPAAPRLSRFPYSFPSVHSGTESDRREQRTGEARVETEEVSESMTEGTDR